MKITVKGLDKVKDNLDKLQENIDAASGTNSVSLSVLLNDQFMSKHSKLASFDQLLEQNNIKINSQEDFEKLDEKELDKAISKDTDFATWQEMLSQASQEWIVQKIGL